MPTVNPFDKILETKGLKYEDLRPEERELYNKASKDIKTVNLEQLQEQLEGLLFSLTLELCDTPDTSEHQDTNNKLKARVKNYLVLEAYLSAPYKVAKALEKELNEQ